MLLGAEGLPLHAEAMLLQTEALLLYMTTTKNLREAPVIGREATLARQEHLRSARTKNN